MHFGTKALRPTVAALLLSLGLASGAHAMGPRHHGPGFSPERVMHLMEKLDVSATQRDQIFAIVDEVQPQLRKLKFAQRDAHKEIRAILASGQYNEAAVAQIATAQGENTAQMIRLTAGMMARVSALLTPAQRTELSRILEKRHRG